MIFFKYLSLICDIFYYSSFITKRIINDRRKHRKDFHCHS